MKFYSKFFFLQLQRCSPPSLVLSLSPGLGPDGLPSPGGAGPGHYSASNANGNSNRSSPFSSSEQVLKAELTPKL